MGKSCFVDFCVLLVLSAGSRTPSLAQTFNTLVSFSGENGATPLYESLVQGTDGNFYGTTSGVTQGAGTIFKMTPNGTLTTLYNLPNGSKGASLQTGLVLARSGEFYGTTYYGGAHDVGAVFRITASGTLTNLYSFSGADGAFPTGQLVQANGGEFYGATAGGGSSNLGTIFKITPSGTLTIVHSFGGPDGSGPNGADVTLLLAASSFISSFDGKQDPRAREAFVALATSYCNGASLLMPLPHYEVEEIPIFYSLWRERAAVATIPEMELSNQAFAAISAPGAQSFAEYAEGFPSDISRWIAFHFTPAIADVYHQRSDLGAIKRCAPLARQLLERRALVKLEASIGKRQDEDLVATSHLYENLVGTTDIPSFLHLCIAYALSISLRGYSYAVALGSQESGPLYQHHWVRAPIVRRFGSEEHATKVVSESIMEFPWGVILQAVFNPAAPLARRGPQTVAEVLDKIRDRSDQVRTAIQDGVLTQLAAAGGDRITDAEVFVLDILRDAGVSPRYASSTFLQRAVQLARTISNKSPFLSVLVEMITANLQPGWLRRPETALRVQFRRDSFWKVMEDPLIRRALRSMP